MNKVICLINENLISEKSFSKDINIILIIVKNFKK